MTHPISFQILSDLHLEIHNPPKYKFHIKPTSPYLALLGAIGKTKHKPYLTFLETQLSKFQIVFLVLGNHEPYDSSWEAAIETMEDFEREVRAKCDGNQGGLGRFVFLNRTTYDISPDVTVLGCTLHSQVLPEEEERVSYGLNDFHKIAGWTVEDHIAAHHRDLNWLNQEVQSISATSPDRKIVIFTHHSPTIHPKACDARHAAGGVTSAFASDLTADTCWRSETVKMWAFGHTHYNCDFVDEKTGKRVVTNQHGYNLRNLRALGFDMERVYEV